MNDNIISKETYNRLSEILFEPDKYLKGEICDYILLSRIDGYFLSSLDKDYLKDYFLIKDWVKFSFYNGGIFEKLFKNDIYKKIPLENIKLIWNAFNENQKELKHKDNRFYHNRRYTYLPKIISLLMRQSKYYQINEFLPFLKEIMMVIKQDEEITCIGYLGRDYAKILGEYILYNKTINEEVIYYLQEQQLLKDLDLSLIFYDWKISDIRSEEKLKILINILKIKKPEVTLNQIIAQSLAYDSNDFHVIKYIQNNFNYHFNEEELTLILNKQKTLTYSDDNVKYIIENFQPSRLVGRTFSQIYKNYRLNSESEKRKFYNDSIEYLQKKVAYDELNKSLSNENENIPKSKI